MEHVINNRQYEVGDGPGIRPVLRFRNFSRACQRARKLSRSGGSYYVFPKNGDSAIIGFADGKRVP